MILFSVDDLSPIFFPNTFPVNCRTGFHKWKYDLNVLNQCVRNGILWEFFPNGQPSPPPCENVGLILPGFFCPCQLSSAVEIRLWEWYKLQNKNFHVYIFVIQIQPQTRFFSCVVELLAREHEIIRLAAFV